MKTIYVAIICVFGLFNLTNAQTISGLSGSFLNNESIVISGSSFGTKTTATPVLWDTVDNISSYSELADGDTIPVGGENPWPSPYGNSSGNNYVKYNTTDSQRGVSTAQYKATNVITGYLDGLTWTATNYAYVSWWWKTDTNVSGSGHSSKFLRMSDSTDEVNKTFSWTQAQNYVYSDPNYCAGEWDGWNGNPNNWNFLEAWFDSANQTYTVKLNGVIFANAVSWSSCSSFSFNELWKIGFDGGGVSPPAITWWMDDIYVDSTFSRVMIGDAPTFASSTHFEMQIISTWATGLITITVNRGSFGASDSAYLFVVDSDGNVSDGYPITFGTEYGATSRTAAGVTFSGCSFH